MGVLKDARQEIADIVTGAGVTSFPYLPGRLTPPVAVIQAGTPYLENGLVFGHFGARHEIIVVANTAANDTATDVLDELVEEVMVALANNNYGIESVSQPYALEMNNTQYPAVTIVSTSEITL